MTASAKVRLGFEVGTGAPVDIPLRNMVVTGQTQEAGKTTTLEALVARSGARALAFVTKRGEGAFAAGRAVQPYFRERADWQYVAAILEATLRERMKFERAWIMRAAKGAQTLADVQRNVRALMEKAKGLNADVYMQLDAYLDIVVPQIAGARFAPAVDLAPGLNVMVLDGFSTELQALVIRSTLEWIYEREQDTIAIIPEAWEFIPQQRGSPVKLAAEQLVRKGSVLRNYVWLDSQDIAGVHKDILRSAPVWVLGVQRESNEIKRTLAHIPTGTAKPKPSDIMDLHLGEFFACFGKKALRAYVQPAWMDEEDARAVARGEIDPRHVRRPALRGISPARLAANQKRRDHDLNHGDDQVDQATAQRLERENEELRRRVDELQRELNAARAATTPLAEARELDVGELYQEIRRRLLDDPAAQAQLLRIRQARPELEVAVERQTIAANAGSGIGFIGLLISEGFFDSATSANAAFEEAKRRGVSGAKPSFYKWCDELTTRGFLRKGPGGYQAVEGMKVNIVEAQ